MSDIRNTLQKLDEMTAGSTGSGSIGATGNGFANGGPGTLKRLEEVDVEETSKSKKSTKNFGFWGNKPQPKKVKVKESKKIIDEADLEEEKLEGKDKKPAKDAIGKKKPEHRDIGAKPADRGIQPKQLREGADEVEALFKRVRNITSGIKHGVDARDRKSVV